ncbi:hypothetical protein DFH27DRAFT_110233 [Peziza echinospora]|nr:hypothetical protein DFH27DRAFT_110233 [Peziza echinospora]
MASEGVPPVDLPLLKGETDITQEYEPQPENEQQSADACDEIDGGGEKLKSLEISHLDQMQREKDTVTTPNAPTTPGNVTEATPSIAPEGSARLVVPVADPQHPPEEYTSEKNLNSLEEKGLLEQGEVKAAEGKRISEINHLEAKYNKELGRMSAEELRILQEELDKMRASRNDSGTPPSVGQEGYMRNLLNKEIASLNQEILGLKAIIDDLRRQLGESREEIERLSLQKDEMQHEATMRNLEEILALQPPQEAIVTLTNSLNNDLQTCKLKLQEATTDKQALIDKIKDLESQIFTLNSQIVEEKAINADQGEKWQSLLDRDAAREAKKAADAIKVANAKARRNAAKLAYSPDLVLREIATKYQNRIDDLEKEFEECQKKLKRETNQDNTSTPQQEQSQSSEPASSSQNLDHDDKNPDLTASVSVDELKKEFEECQKKLKRETNQDNTSTPQQEQSQSSEPASSSQNLDHDDKNPDLTASVSVDEHTSPSTQQEQPKYSEPASSPQNFDSEDKKPTVETVVSASETIAPSTQQEQPKSSKSSESASTQNLVSEDKIPAFEKVVSVDELINERQKHSMEIAEQRKILESHSNRIKELTYESQDKGNQVEALEMMMKDLAAQGRDRLAEEKKLYSVLLAKFIALKEGKDNEIAKAPTPSEETLPQGGIVPREAPTSQGAVVPQEATVTQGADVPQPKLDEDVKEENKKLNVIVKQLVAEQMEDQAAYNDLESKYLEAMDKLQEVEEVQHLKEKLAESDRAYKELESRYINLVDQKAELPTLDKYLEAIHNLQEVEEALELHKGEIEDLKEKLAENDEAYKELEIQHIKLADQNAQLQVVEPEIDEDDHLKIIAELKAKVAKLEGEIVWLERKVEQALETPEMAESRRRDQIAELEERVRTRLENEYLSANKIATDLSEELDSARGKIAELSEELDSARGKIAELSEELDSARGKIAELSENLDSARSKIAELEETIDEILSQPEEGEKAQESPAASSSTGQGSLETISDRLKKAEEDYEAQNKILKKAEENFLECCKYGVLKDIEIAECKAKIDVIAAEYQRQQKLLDEANARLLADLQKCQNSISDNVMQFNIKDEKLKELLGLLESAKLDNSQLRKKIDLQSRQIEGLEEKVTRLEKQRLVDAQMHDKELLDHKNQIQHLLSQRLKDQEILGILQKELQNKDPRTPDLPGELPQKHSGERIVPDGYVEELERQIETQTRECNNELEKCRKHIEALEMELREIKAENAEANSNPPERNPPETQPQQLSPRLYPVTPYDDSSLIGFVIWPLLEVIRDIVHSVPAARALYMSRRSLYVGEAENTPRLSRFRLISSIPKTDVERSILEAIDPKKRCTSPNAWFRALLWLSMYLAFGYLSFMTTLHMSRLERERILWAEANGPLVRGYFASRRGGCAPGGPASGRIGLLGGGGGGGQCQDIRYDEALIWTMARRGWNDWWKVDRRMPT